jgi:hypothetical protein
MSNTIRQYEEQIGPNESEVKRIFITKGEGERLTMIVRYHPATRADEAASTDLPAKLNAWLESLEAQANEALEP